MHPSLQAGVRPVASGRDQPVVLTPFVLRRMRARALGGERGARISRIVAVAMGLLLGVGSVFADGPDGLVLRASGFVKGRAEISDDQIRCEVPTVESAIV